jgi:hypothetical protein
MSEVRDRERDVLAACVLRTDIIRSGAGPRPVRETSLELGIVDEQTFDRMVDPATMVKPCVVAIDRNREAPLLVVALTLVAALGTLAISLFWPYLIPFFMDRG